MRGSRRPLGLAQGSQAQALQAEPASRGAGASPHQGTRLLGARGRSLWATGPGTGLGPSPVISSRWHCGCSVGSTCFPPLMRGAVACCRSQPSCCSGEGSKPSCVRPPHVPCERGVLRPELSKSPRHALAVGRQVALAGAKGRCGKGRSGASRTAPGAPLTLRFSPCVPGQCPSGSPAGRCSAASVATLRGPNIQVPHLSLKSGRLAWVRLRMSVMKRWAGWGKHICHSLPGAAQMAPVST